MSILTVGSSPVRSMRLNLPIVIVPLRHTDNGYWIFQTPVAYGMTLTRRQRSPITGNAGNAEDVLKLFGNLLKRRRTGRKQLGGRRSPPRREQIHRKRHEESYVPDHRGPKRHEPTRRDPRIHVCLSGPEKIRVRWGRREPDSHHEGTKDDIANSVSGRGPGSLTNDSSDGIPNDCRGRRTEKYTRPSAGEIHIPVSPPDNLGPHSPTSGGTVDTEPSPLDNRDQLCKELSLHRQEIFG